MAGDRPKILVVDDSRHTRQLFRKLLEEANYETFDAGDGVQALKFLGSHTVDLVLLDMVMPNMDGTNTLIHMRNMNLDTPVILITSITESSVIANCMQYNVSEFIVKPFNKEELLAKVGLLVGPSAPVITTNELMCPTLFVGQERVGADLGKLLPDNIHLESSTNRIEAETKCQDQKFERIVIDLNPPPEGTVQKLRELQPAAFIYQVYLRSESDPAGRCLREGYDGYLLKPLSKKQMTMLFNLEHEWVRPFEIDDFVLELSAPQPGQAIEEQYIYPLGSSLGGAVESLAEAQFEYVVLQLTHVPLCEAMLKCLALPIDIALDMGLEVRFVVTEAQESYLISQNAFNDITFHDSVAKAVIALAG